MSDYVKGEDNWKKVKHTNLSDAQADIAALQARVEELEKGVKALYEVATVLPKNIESYERLTMSPSIMIKHCKALLEGSKHGIDTRK